MDSSYTQQYPSTPQEASGEVATPVTPVTPVAKRVQVTRTRVATVVTALEKADALIGTAALLCEEMTDGKQGPIIDLLSQNELLAEASGKLVFVLGEVRQAQHQLENL